MTHEEFELLVSNFWNNIKIKQPSNRIGEIIDNYNKISTRQKDDKVYFELGSDILAAYSYLKGGTETHYNPLRFVCEQTLIDKAKEYAPEDRDRLHNFEKASKLTKRELTAYKAAWCFGVKHLVSFVDICEGLCSEEYLEEKTKDLINYITIMYAMC